MPVPPPPPQVSQRERRRTVRRYKQCLTLTVTKLQEMRDARAQRLALTEFTELLVKQPQKHVSFASDVRIMIKDSGQPYLAAEMTNASTSDAHTRGSLADVCWTFSVLDRHVSSHSSRTRGLERHLRVSVSSMRMVKKGLRLRISRILHFLHRVNRSSSHLKVRQR